ncbi:Similar to WD domain-containing protein [Ajellomyces dermatitidis ATCC 18188]; acc. no. EGE77513 [Pyronema omphalodes CBS 100304]|uniref:Similar to WD domain-containing protein [Ajellomyces dermatitidis ATCC 18188] acc. no. EGE77513 n=1 Tax=Pyronema omphalodes (strain CBS 100304) TaxID=1076935 RepID=U4LVI2_PYROM|nr:Similar to WD domain-containing protein [Ajellomyces dermatitidis ATCC 18188]; acc. no. EGE77513 [Pyronema omphalodes CBS 100304]
MVKNIHAAFAQVMDFFESIEDRLQYISSLDTTFKDKQLVKSALVSVYTAIVDFWFFAVKHYRSKFKKILQATLKITFSDQMKTRFDGLQKECNNQTENLARVTAAQHYSDAALHFEQTGKLLKAERNLKFKAWIGAPNYEMDFRRADKKRYKDTCRWILDKDPYKSWESSPTGQLHVVYGIPGAGKTILSSFLVKEARSKLQPGSPNPSGTVLYHYFKGDDETKSTATTAVRSLLRQLYEFYLLNSVADALSDLETALYSTAHKATPDFDDSPQTTIKVVVTGRTAGPHVNGFQSHATPIIDMS